MDKISFGIYKLDGSEFAFQCQQCGYKKQINGKNFQKLKYYRKVRIKCKCGTLQRFILERRKNDRIAVKLPGVFYHTGANGKPDFKNIDINDVSTRGMCFQISDISNCAPAAGNKVLIVFKPNSKASSLISKQASIKNVQDNNYHVEFSKNGNPCDNLLLKISLYSNY